MQYYLHINKDNSFSFYVEGIHDIDKDKDIKITEEDYNKFFEEQSNGKQYKLKDELPEEKGGLFDYIEEYTPEPINVPKTEEELYKENLEKYILELDYRLSCKELKI